MALNLAQDAAAEHVDPDRYLRATARPPVRLIDPDDIDHPVIDLHPARPAPPPDPASMASAAAAAEAARDQVRGHALALARAPSTQPYIHRVLARRRQG